MDQDVLSSCPSCSPTTKQNAILEEVEKKSSSNDTSRIASSTNISSIASIPEYDIDSTLTVADLKKKLCDLAKSKATDLIMACRSYDKGATSKVSMTQLRQVLRMFCFPISAAQFEALCNELKLDTSVKIDYREFIRNLGNLKRIELGNANRRPIPENFSVDELELRIKEAFGSNLHNVIRSFWLFDMNKDGLVQKKELRRIIGAYCCQIPDNLYNELWKSYDPKSAGAISYKRILIRLGINAERYKKYMPPEMAASCLSGIDEKARSYMVDNITEQRNRRAAKENRDDPLIQGLPIDEVVKIFCIRVQRRYALLKNTFKLFDYENNGFVSVADFHAIMNFFVMATSENMFNQILNRLKIEIPSTNKICIEGFLDKYCRSGASLQMRRDTDKFDCFPVIQRIKNNVLNPDARLRSVFTQHNKDNGWQITRLELRKAIEMGLAFNLTDEEFRQLIVILDPGNTNIIECKEFLKLFESNKNIPDPDPSDVFGDQDTLSKKYLGLEGDKLKSKLKHYLNKNLLNIERTLLVCDMGQSSLVPTDRLKEILDMYCFVMTEDQFDEILGELRMIGDNINYNEFLRLYQKKPNEDVKKWISAVDKLVQFKSRCDPSVPMSEVEEILYECVKAKRKGMLRDFKALDLCNVGVAYKEDFRNIINKYVFRLNDKQFKELWKKVPLNSFGQLIYEKFLDEFSQPPKKFATDTGSLAPQKTDKKPSQIAKTEEELKPSPVPSDRSKADFWDKSQSPRCDKSRPYDRSKKAKDAACAAAPHLKEIIDVMEPLIIKNFRLIRHHLRRLDPKLTGVVDFNLLKPILIHCGIKLSEEEVFHILEYFDGKLTGKINYRDFLRIFVWYA